MFGAEPICKERANAIGFVRRAYTTFFSPNNYLDLMLLRKYLANPINKRRNVAVLIAFLVAPVLPAAVFAAISPGLGISLNLESLVGGSLVFYLYACGVIANLGVPLYLLALKFNLVKFWTALLAGTLGGGAVALFLPAGMPSPYYGAGVREVLPIYVPLGALTGALFFLTLLGANCLLRVNSRSPRGGL
jgi:hypothetical protein